jgi:hypothetical protein
MARSSRNWFVLGASGWISLSTRMEIKMETYYQKNSWKEQKSKQPKPEVSILLSYRNEISPEEKDLILKDVYSTIYLFEKLLYQTRQKSFRNK